MPRPSPALINPDPVNQDPVRLGPQEQKVCELLLLGCDQKEIAQQLQMARRTVKAHFHTMYLKFGITGGIQRVKLAVLLYRREAARKSTEFSTAGRK